MVTWKFSHIQEKPVADSISLKFYGFCYFYNFCEPWEYITYSEHLPLTLVYHTSNLKQEKPTADVLLSIFIAFVIFRGCGNFSGPHISTF